MTILILAESLRDANNSLTEIVVSNPDQFEYTSRVLGIARMKDGTVIEARSIRYYKSIEYVPDQIWIYGSVYSADSEFFKIFWSRTCVPPKYAIVQLDDGVIENE